MRLAASAETDHSHANIIGRTKHLRPRTRGKAHGDSTRSGGGKETTTIHLFHRIGSDLTFENFVLLKLLRLISRVFGITLGDPRLPVVTFVKVEVVFSGDSLVGRKRWIGHT